MATPKPTPTISAFCTPTRRCTTSGRESSTPTLIATADTDDRVVPLHSFKFAATLQTAAPAGGNPLLLRVETRAGHGLGKPTTKLIAEWADIYAFLAATLGK